MNNLIMKRNPKKHRRKRIQRRKRNDKLKIIKRQGKAETFPMMKIRTERTLKKPFPCTILHGLYFIDALSSSLFSQIEK